MKFIKPLIAIVLIFLQINIAVSQEKKERVMEKLDIKEFNQQQENGRFVRTLDNGVTIEQTSDLPYGFMEDTKSSNSPYVVRKIFYPTGELLSVVTRFYGCTIGKSPMYDA